MEIGKPYYTAVNTLGWAKAVSLPLVVSSSLSLSQFDIYTGLIVLSGLSELTDHAYKAEYLTAP